MSASQLDCEREWCIPVNAVFTVKSSVHQCKVSSGCGESQPVDRHTVACMLHVYTWARQVCFPRAS